MGREADEERERVAKWLDRLEFYSLRGSLKDVAALVRAGEHRKPICKAKRGELTAAEFAGRPVRKEKRESEAPPAAVLGPAGKVRAKKGEA